MAKFFPPDNSLVRLASIQSRRDRASVACCHDDGAVESSERKQAALDR